MNRDEISIRAEGAELFVQSYLMLHFGIIVSQASRCMPGYDLIAHNFNKPKDCKISVKYRSATNSDGFNFSDSPNKKDFDIFIGILGNLGKIGKIGSNKEIQAEDLKVYILSFDQVKNRLKLKSKNSKTQILRINTLENTDIGSWSKILKFLGYDF